VSGPRFEELDGEVEEAPGLLESLARGAKQGITFGFGDEISGAAAATGHVIGRSARRAREGNIIPDSLDEIGQELEGIAAAYRKGRDEIRDEDAAADRANPGTFAAGEIGGALVPAALTGGAGLTLRGAAAVGAAEGAAAGLGNSRAELTDGDVYEYIQALTDTATGAGLGAAGGAAGHFVGQGVRAIGRKAARGLDDARESLWREEGQRGIREFTEREEKEIARRQGLRDAESKEAAAMDKAHGQALELNKGASRRAERSDRAALERAERESNRRAGARTQADHQLQSAMDEQEALELVAQKDAARQASESERFARARTEIDRPAQLRMQEIEADEAAAGARTQADRRLRDLAREQDRAEREAVRAARRPRGAPPLSQEPGTKTLGGYEGAANRRWRDNYGKVKGDREMLERPDLAPAERERLERYVVDHGEAVDNPGAFQRRIMAEELRRRGYSRELVDRIMSERVGPNGEILPRRRPQAEALPEPEELTQPGDMFDAAVRGEARAGGGGSAFEGWPEDARTLAAPVEELPGWAAGVEAMRSRVPPQPAGLGPLPQRRMPPPSSAPTRGGEAEMVVREAEEALARRGADASMSTPQDGPPPMGPTATIRTPDTLVDPPATPTATRRMTGGEDTIPDAGAATPRLEPAAAPQGFERLRSPAMEGAMARERGAGGATVRAGAEGARSGYKAMGVLGAALGGLHGVTRGALKDPAVKARVISALRLAHLERANPQVFSRVGRAMVHALSSGDPGDLAAFEHVQLQTDPDFRVAHREAEAATRNLADDELLAELEAAGVIY
jgi:hypothetical protein